jgi:hypothetical protein
MFPDGRTPEGANEEESGWIAGELARILQANKDKEKRRPEVAGGAQCKKS